MSIAINIKKLSKCYKNNLMALDNISLKIERGDLFSLVGPNGAGKTTLIRILNSAIPGQHKKWHE